MCDLNGIKNFLIASGRVESVSWLKAKALCRAWAQANEHKSGLWDNSSDVPGEVKQTQDILQLFFFSLVSWEKGHGVFGQEQFREIITFDSSERDILAKTIPDSYLDQIPLYKQFDQWWESIQEFDSHFEGLLHGISENQNQLLIPLKPSDAQVGLEFTLPKLYQDQKKIKDDILQKLSSSSEIDENRLNDCIDNVFQAKKEVIQEGIEPHYKQIFAAIMACYQNFMVITGGPGTGKTTVAKLVLWALKKQMGIEASDITLAAPTGRARGRLVESLKSNMSGEGFKNQRAFFDQIEAKTLHALLGVGFKREIKEINAQVVLVDECSMMDLRMFALLLASLKPNTKLILLGDKDQLPSVNAGQILADITGEFVRLAGDNLKIPTLSKSVLDKITSHDSFLKHQECMDKSPSQYEKTEWDKVFNKGEIQPDEILNPSSSSPNSPIMNHVVFLTKSFRSSQNILDWWANPNELLSQPNEAVNELLWDTESDVWKQKEGERKKVIQELIQVFKSQESIFKGLTLAPEDLFALASTADQKDLFTKVESLNVSFRFLCAHNNGPLSVEWFNEIALKLYGTAKSLFNYGIPIIIKKNQKLRNYQLANGDLGFLGKVKGDSSWRVIVPNGNEILALPITQILEWDYAFAISIHKSQGSEFKSVVLSTTRSDQSPLWTRQLIYTGVTRAKKQLTIIYPSSQRIKFPSHNNLRKSLINFNE